jgi:hypothetical protein
MGTPWSRLLHFRSLLGRLSRIDKGADFSGVNARQNREAVRPQDSQNRGERSHSGRRGRLPFLDYRGNKRGDGRRSYGLSIRADNCDLEKDGRKRTNVPRRAPPFARERFSVARFQADRICIAMDIARFQASVEQPEAVCKRSSPVHYGRFLARGGGEAHDSVFGFRVQVPNDYLFTGKRDFFAQLQWCRLFQFSAKSIISAKLRVGQKVFLS